MPLACRSRTPRSDPDAYAATERALAALSYRGWHYHVQLLPWRDGPNASLPMHDGEVQGLPRLLLVRRHPHTGKPRVVASAPLQWLLDATPLEVDVLLRRMVQPMWPGRGEDVVTVHDGNFEAEVLRHAGAVLVHFYAAWCVGVVERRGAAGASQSAHPPACARRGGLCKAMAIDFAAAATALRGEVKVAALNGPDEVATSIAAGIAGYPTIALYPAGEGKEVGVYWEYRGSRAADDMVAAMRDMVAGRVDTAVWRRH